MNFLPEVLLFIFLIGGILAIISWRKKSPILIQSFLA